jgi:hypothetical protein
MVLETAKTATGTSVDFTGIPSWVKRVTVMLNGVSTGGTSAHLLQLGDSGGIENTGYVSGAATVGTSSAAGTNSTAGFILMQAAVAAGSYSGHSIITQVSENTWILSGSLGYSANGGSYCGGTKTLSDTLTQLRLTTVNGTDTFDAGSINLLLEG